VKPPLRVDPYELATYRKNASVDIAFERVQVGELFSAQTIALEGDPAPFPPTGRTRYGLVAQMKKGGSLIARWNEAEVQLHSATPLSERDVLAAFGKP
jgi:hypothetical protein